tara:strand:- start:399 stop:2387 length:1989 start_codon:yes stop_codon:yes gene_type:complete
MRLLSFFLILLVISSCGGGGGGGSSEPPVPGASITLSISDDEIYLGNSVTLTWTTSNASSCSASGSWAGSRALSGSETVTPDSEGQKTYTLTCSNSAGTSTSRTVSTNVIVPAPSVNLSADPTSVLLNNTSTLTWSSSNASSCSANWTSQTSSSGSEAVTISTAGDNSFSISCSGAGGTVSVSVTIAAYLSSDCMQDGSAVSDFNELKNAIISSSGDGEDNIIYIHDGTYNFSEVIIYDAKGTLEYLTLRGCYGENSQIIFDGNNISRIFEFQKNGPWIEGGDARDAQPPYPSVDINDIEFRNAFWDRVSYEDVCWHQWCGSVIYANRFNINFNNTHFKNNSVTNNGHIVGEIVNLGITNSVFEDSSGKVISFSGDLDMQNTTFLNNRGIALYAGIAAYVDCHTRTIKDSVFDSNDKAFYSLDWGCNEENISQIQLEIENTSFLNNEYGLAIRGTNVNIFNSRFENNFKGYGSDQNGFCDSNFDGSFDGTQLTGHDMNCLTGAAIMFDKWIRRWGVLRIENSVFKNNQARDFGGAIDMLGSVRCDDSNYFRYLEGCSGSNNPIDAIDLIIRSSSFIGNSSHRGAAISVAKRGPQGGNILIEDSVFEDNNGVRPEEYIQTVEDYETSIIVTGGNAEIYNTTFLNNEAEIELQVKGSLQCDNSC